MTNLLIMTMLPRTRMKRKITTDKTPGSITIPLRVGALTRNIMRTMMYPPIWTI